MQRKLMSLVVMLAAAWTPAGMAADFDLSWFTIDAGGGYCTGGAYELDGTLGQLDAGVLTGGTFELVGGFWAAPGAPACPGDTDGDLDVDITDLGVLLSNFGMNGAGIAGDVDADGDVDITDLGIVLSQFGATCL